MNKKFTNDIIANYISFALLALSGVLTNIIIGKFYGAQALGHFNISYAVYIFGSQFAAFGIHYSTLKSVAVNSNNHSRTQLILSSALIATLLPAAVISSLVYLFSSSIGHCFQSEIIIHQLLALSPTLFFFAINKVLFATCNGLKKMYIFSAGQAIRSMVVLLTLLWLTYTEQPEASLTLIFLCAEIAVFLFVFSTLVVNFPKLLFFSLKHIKKHLWFGAQSFSVGLMVEINTRVDILILGLFVDKKFVGVYSFAAMFAEGVYQLLVVVKTNINPYIAQFLYHGNYLELANMIKKIRIYIYRFGLALLLVTIIGYPLLIEILDLPKVFMDGWAVYIILAGSIYLSSGILSFDNILVLSGKPHWQTAYNACVVLLNILLNLALIPYFGIIGSSIATALSTYLFAACLLNYFGARQLQFNLLRA